MHGAPDDGRKNSRGGRASPTPHPPTHRTWHADRAHTRARPFSVLIMQSRYEARKNGVGAGLRGGGGRGAHRVTVPVRAGCLVIYYSGRKHWGFTRFPVRGKPVSGDRRPPRSARKEMPTICHYAETGTVHAGHHRPAARLDVPANPRGALVWPTVANKTRAVSAL